MKYKLTTESDLNSWKDFDREEVSIRIKNFRKKQLLLYDIAILNNEMLKPFSIIFKNDVLFCP